MTAAPAGDGLRRPWHRRTNAVVMVYVGAALAALLGRSALPMPRWLAVHLLLLGAVTNAIVTWSEHFAVVLLRARAPSHRSSALRLTALNVAVVGVLFGVARAVPIVSVIAATLLVAVVLAHAGSLVFLSRRALMGRFAGTVRFYVAACAALVAGATIGAIMTSGSLAARHEELHAAHVHANVFGWIGLSVLGTLFTLWPTVLRTRMADGVMTAANRSLWSLVGGLAAVVSGFALGLRWVAVAGLAAYGIGVVVALLPFARTWQRKPPHDAAGWSMAAGTLWLLGAVVADFVLLTRARDVPSYVPSLDKLVPALAAGFALQTLLGALTFLVPVMRGGGPTVLRATMAWLARGWAPRVIALNAGVLLLVVTEFAGSPVVLLRLGWLLIAAPVACFVALVSLAAIPGRRLSGPTQL